MRLYYLGSHDTLIRPHRKCDCQPWWAAQRDGPVRWEFRVTVSLSKAAWNSSFKTKKAWLELDMPHDGYTLWRWSLGIRICAWTWGRLKLSYGLESKEQCKKYDRCPPKLTVDPPTWLCKEENLKGQVGILEKVKIDATQSSQVWTELFPITTVVVVHSACLKPVSYWIYYNSPAAVSSFC
jgi:hypothetical protein